MLFAVAGTVNAYFPCVLVDVDDALLLSETVTPGSTAPSEESVTVPVITLVWAFAVNAKAQTIIQIVIICRKFLYILKI